MRVPSFRTGGRTIALFLAIALFLFTGCMGNDFRREADSPPTPSDDVGGQLASSGSSAVLEGLLKGASEPISEIISSEVLGLIMGELHLGGSNPDEQILDDLGQIEGTLTQIEADLQTIEDQLKAIELELQIDTSDIEKQIVTGGLNPYVGQIESLWVLFSNLHSTDGWNSDPAELAGLADAILDSDDGAFPQFENIHLGLTGEGGYSDNILRLVAENAALHTNAGGDHLAGYLLIENYFGAMLRVESRAAVLMVEALRYRDAANTAMAPSVFTGNAEQFMALYQAYIEDQVEVFLQAVEAYVTMTADPTHGFDQFAPDVQDIFWRADLVAAWMSRRHRPSPEAAQSLLVYRVIGGPERVAKYGSGFDVLEHFDTMLYRPDGTSDPQYDIPNYVAADNHSYSDLTVNRYVQFLTPQAQDGGPMQHGAIASADSIMIGKYWFGGFNTPVTVELDAFLDDIPCHWGAHVPKDYYDASGKLATASTGICYGCWVDVQQPPAAVMGSWDLNLLREDRDRLHDSDSRLSGNADFYNAQCIPQSMWVQLYGMAYPRWEFDVDSTDDDLQGYFLEEYALVGNYYWADENGVNLRPHATVTIDSTVNYDGSPANRWAGMWFHFGKPSGNVADNPIALTSYNTGTLSRQLTLDPGGSLSVAPDNEYYASFGSRMDINYDGKSADHDDWHHWDATIRTTLNDFWFTID